MRKGQACGTQVFVLIAGSLQRGHDVPRRPRGYIARGQGGNLPYEANLVEFVGTAPNCTLVLTSHLRRGIIGRPSRTKLLEHKKTFLLILLMSVSPRTFKTPRGIVGI